MAVYKCKMCGGELHVEEGMKVVECEYCGSSQTVASSNDDKILKLYARGNLLRTQNDFDKAYNIFEQIIVENPQDAEGYWNLLLCKYGITYVDDYDGSKKPTINRMSMTSIKDDQDYIKVLENADVVSKAIYKQQVSQIAKIQEDILKIVKNEEPYDIFISYKETDEFCDRTEDSVLAQEIYDTLTKEGYKVFLSRVTLANAIGSEYEPYIYSALYSSKLMILVTTKEEYVNAVWVKNEWSRFLKMMKEDSSKKIIPCFKNVDPYDLPKEIRNIQSINFDKLGAIQDLVIGVNKILGKSIKNVKETVSTSTGTQTETLLKRVSMFLNDNEWEKANEYCEKVLDIDPENAQAYLYKFLIECEVSNLGVITLDNFAEDICDDANLNKALKFAKGKLKKELSEFEERINNSRLEKENYRKINNKKCITIDINIEKNAFLGCDNIEMVTILKNVQIIGCDAFCGCSSLKSVRFEEGSKLESIGERAFENCRNLTSIVIPNGVTSIGKDAFYNCISLTSITLPFVGDSLNGTSNTHFGYIFGAPSYSQNVVYVPESLKEVIITGGSSVGFSAFSNCSSLTNIKIPSSVTSIGSYAFYECKNLTSIFIPNSVTSIGKSAFSNCRNLTSATFEEGSQLASIEENTFFYCSSLRNIKIPSSVTSIDKYAFLQCPCEEQVRNRTTSSTSGSTTRPTTSSYSSYSTSSKKGGCYVATCVYGSYDCPEVWTLRRFRDNTLGSTWYGRLFIRIYYAISPKLVKWFGDKKWFKKIWKNTLDRMVDKLKSKGVENTPYDDKKW